MGVQIVSVEDRDCDVRRRGLEWPPKLVVGVRKKARVRRWRGEPVKMDRERAFLVSGVPSECAKSGSAQKDEC